MNQSQKDYDKKVQNVNRKKRISILKKKLLELTDFKNRLRLIANTDKNINGRKQTLVEYKVEINEYTDEIKKKTKELRYLKKKNKKEESEKSLLLERKKIIEIAKSWSSTQYNEDYELFSPRSTIDAVIVRTKKELDELNNGIKKIDGTNVIFLIED